MYTQLFSSGENSMRKHFLWLNMGGLHEWIPLWSLFTQPKTGLCHPLSGLIWKGLAKAEWPQPLVDSELKMMFQIAQPLLGAQG